MAWDAVWEDVFSTRAWGMYPAEDLIRFVARNFYQTPDRAKVKALELGCGPGANLWFLAREGFATYGIDGSETAVKLATQRLDGDCPNWRVLGGEVRVGDFQNLPYEDGYFDFVIDNEAVYCNSFDISHQVYSESARILKKHGLIFIRTFATGCWGEGTGAPLGYNAWKCAEGPFAGKGYARFSSRGDLDKLLDRFKILSVELLTRTEANGTHSIKEWLVTAQKSD